MARERARVMTDQDLPTTIEALTPIWEHVFARAHVGSEDDFFELGGNASLAAQLFAEISQKLGTNLSPAVICAAPTISALARRLTRPAVPLPLIPLRSGIGMPPVFMTHGIGSSVIDLVPLTRRMQVGQPIYGMEARGNDGREEPLDRIQEMAQFFLESVRRVQPEGPYFLIGFSFGGVVALEMARLLMGKGEKIALLVMLDSYPDRHRLPIGQHAHLVVRLAKNRLTTWTHTPAQSGGHAAVAHQGTAVASAMRRVKDAQYRALRNYRPRPYEGNVKFIRAGVPTHFPADPIPVWSHFVRTLEVETVPGRHLEMLTIQCETLAVILNRYIRAAGAGK